MNALRRVVAWVDTPTVGQRTPREWLLIVFAAGLLVFTVAQPRPYWINAALYVVALACALVRFYATRGLGVGIAVSAWIQHWAVLQSDDVTLAMLRPMAWWPPVLLLVLTSRDLEARYERGESALRWLPNPWVRLPVWDLRLMRWCAYALGCQAGMLSLAWMRTHRPLDASAWPMFVTVALAVVLLLLALGKPLALFLSPPLAAWTLVHTVPLLEDGWRRLHHGPMLPDPVFRASAEYILPLTITCTISFVIATAYALLLVRRRVEERARPRAATGGATGAPVTAVEALRQR